MLASTMPDNQTSKTPEFGQMRFIDYVLLMCCIFRILLWELPVFLLTYASVHADSSTPFVVALQYFLIRKTNLLLNPTSIRWLTRPGAEHVDRVLASRRYKPYKGNIYNIVARPDFLGFWIMQSSIKSKERAATSDLTIFYLHGGGYISSQPAHYLLFLLKLGETILEQGISVSIFALDYSLAPEHTFPSQLEETAAAYRYLVNEEHVVPEKMLLAGDSAGGHLALSFLVDLAKRQSVSVGALSKPRGLVLLSPWLSLHNESHSFTANAHKDILSAFFLRGVARKFLGHPVAFRNSSQEKRLNSPLLEFLTPEPEIDWDAVLPSWIWVSVGTNEIFIDNVKTWVGLLEGRLGKERVTLEMGPEKVHVWQWLETIMDEGMRRDFLEMRDVECFGATADVGRAIAERIRRDSRSR